MCVFLFTQAWSLDRYERILGKKLYNRLISEKSLQHTFKDAGDLLLFPNLPIKDRIETEVARMDPTLGVELLLLYSPPFGTKRIYNEKSRYHLGIYNILRSVSSLKGIQYYSASRKRMRVFFHDAYAIESPQKRTRLEDPLVEEIPINDTFYAFIRDSSLGDYVAEAYYHYHYDYFAMKIENLTTLWRFIFRLVEPRDLSMFVLLLPQEDSILFYGLTYINAVNLFGIMDAKTASFYNRLKALFNWFSGSMEKLIASR
jgi:hypothetical protein